MTEVDLTPWERLAKEMLASGKYNPRDLTPASLFKDLERGIAMVRWDPYPEGVVEYGTLEMARDGSCQIRKLFVAKDHGGNGNGRLALEHIVRRLLLVHPRVSRYFAMTDTKAVIEVLEKLGFKRVTRSSMPDVGEWARKADFYDRLPTELKGEDPDGRYLLVLDI